MQRYSNRLLVGSYDTITIKIFVATGCIPIKISIRYDNWCIIHPSEGALNSTERESLVTGLSHRSIHMMYMIMFMTMTTNAMQFNNDNHFIWWCMNTINCFFWVKSKNIHCIKRMNTMKIIDTTFDIIFFLILCPTLTHIWTDM